MSEFEQKLNALSQSIKDAEADMFSVVGNNPVFLQTGLAWDRKNYSFRILVNGRPLIEYPVAQRIEYAKGLEDLLMAAKVRAKQITEGL
jgi:hypothetical protein